MNKPTPALIDYVLGVFENRVSAEVDVGSTSFEFSVVHPHDTISYAKVVTRLAHKHVRDVVFRPTRVSYAGKTYHGIKTCVRTDASDAECERFAEDLRVERRHKGPSAAGATTMPDAGGNGGITPSEMRTLMELFHTLFERHPIDGNRVVPYRISPDRLGLIVACVRPPPSAAISTQYSDGALTVNELNSIVDLIRRIVGGNALDDVILVNSAHIPAFSSPVEDSSSSTTQFVPISTTTTAAAASTTETPSSVVARETTTTTTGMGRLCLKIVLRTTSRKRSFVSS